jgi:N-acetylneuraminic acid mutarotase
MVGGKAYLVGGRGYKPVDIYDPVTKTWTTGAQAPQDIHHVQCVAARAKIWVMAAWTGGYPQEKNAEYIYVYDPATNQWSTKTALPADRRRGSAAVVVSNDESKIYVSHGNTGGHEQNNFAVSLGYLDVYDIDNDSWTALPDAPNPRDHTCAAIIDGRICVAGGRNGGEVGWPAVSATDCYDIATRTWSVEAAIPNNRSGAACGTTCDGKLMVAGGEEEWKAQEYTSIFDGKKWTNLAPLVDSRHGTGLAVDCQANLIYIASGAGEGGGGPELLTMETFYPDGIPR